MTHWTDRWWNLRKITFLLNSMTLNLNWQLFNTNEKPPNQTLTHEIEVLLFKTKIKCFWNQYSKSVNLKFNLILVNLNLHLMRALFCYISESPPKILFFPLLFFYHKWTTKSWNSRYILKICTDKLWRIFSSCKQLFF